MTDLPTPEKLNLSDLWRLACVYGVPSIYGREDEEPIAARIERNLGNSTIETGYIAGPTPEAALLAAIEEAKTWGLPLVEVE